ncbi:hypothetical protein I876_05065 [Alteromonas mediterranea U7]|nr:hypothetical protein I876_05065 [Alteromonas mediterranea U7]AGP92995.1 hypothetical protein I634_06345 [Alteromonas mediterranea U8]
MISCGPAPVKYMIPIGMALIWITDRNLVVLSCFHVPVQKGTITPQQINAIVIIFAINNASLKIIDTM